MKNSKAKAFIKIIEKNSLNTNIIFVSKTSQLMARKKSSICSQSQSTTLRKVIIDINKIWWTSKIMKIISIRPLRAASLHPPIVSKDISSLICLKLNRVELGINIPRQKWCKIWDSKKSNKRLYNRRRKKRKSQTLEP